MNTTLVFAELLIIGLEGGVWVSFLLLSLFGAGTFEKPLTFLQDWQLLVLPTIFALIYVLGVIIDRVADSLFRGKEEKIDNEIVGDLPVTISVMRFSLGTQNDFLNQQLDYTRTRIRIVRASIVNFPLIALSLSLFLLTGLPNIPANLQWNYAIIILGVGILAAYAAYRTWRSLIIAHLKLAKGMYEYQTQKNEQIKKSMKS